MPRINKNDKIVREFTLEVIPTKARSKTEKPGKRSGEQSSQSGSSGQDGSGASGDDGDGASEGEEPQDEESGAEPDPDDEIEFAVMDEQPVDRGFGWKEIALVNETSIIGTRLNKPAGVMLLYNHNWDEYLGSVISWRIENKRLLCKVKFSSRTFAQEVLADVKSGCFKNVSLSYIVKEYSVDEDQKIETITSYEPYEITLQTVPASVEVGIGRAMQFNNNSKKESEMTEEEKRRAAEAEKKRAEDIAAHGKIYKREIMAQAAIDEGVSYDAYRKMVDADVQQRGLGINSIDPNGKDAQKPYDFGRAMRSLFTSENCFERELSQEIENKNPNVFKSVVGKRSIVIPGHVLSRNLDSVSGIGIQNLSTNSSMFVDAVYSKDLLARLGVQMITGLSGLEYWGEASQGANAGWRDPENPGNLAKSGFATTQILVRPKNLVVYDDVDNNLANTSSPAGLTILQTNMQRALRSALQKALLYGTGQNGQPLGVFNDVRVAEFKKAVALTYDDLIDVQGELDADDMDLTYTKYFLSPKQKAVWKRTPLPGAVPQMALVKGYIDEFEALASSSMSEKDSVFGDFSWIAIAAFNGVRITIDETTQALEGITRLIIDNPVDIVNRQRRAFRKFVNCSIKPSVLAA